MKGEEKPYQDFASLELWKCARDFQIKIFELTKGFPPEEKFRLTDQIVRSSRSISAKRTEHITGIVGILFN